jgi:hypothetical protein
VNAEPSLTTNRPKETIMATDNLATIETGIDAINCVHIAHSFLDSLLEALDGALDDIPACHEPAASLSVRGMNLVALAQDQLATAKKNTDAAEKALLKARRP